MTHSALSATAATVSALALVAGVRAFAVPIQADAAPRAGQQAPAEQDRRYRAGLGLLHRGLHEEALAELRAFLEARPTSAEAPTARYALAVCLAQVGRPAEALRELDAIQAPGFEFAPDALLLRGQCAMETGRFDDAAQALARLAAEHEGFGQLEAAAVLRGEALSRAGRHEEALAVLVDATRRWPEGPHRDRADFFAARSASAGGDDRAAVARLTALLERSPGSPWTADARLMHAHALERLGELEQAILAYGRFEERHAADPRRWEAGVRRGLCLMRSARAEEGRPLLEAAVADAGAEPRAGRTAARPGAASPDAALLRAALFALGDDALASGRHDEAERWFGALAGKDDARRQGAGMLDPPVDEQATPRRSEVLLRLALSVQRQGRAAEALPLLQEVLDRHGGERAAAQAHFELGQALLALDRSEEARQALEAAAAADDEAARRFRAPALRQLAALVAAAGRPGDAADLLAQASLADEVDVGDAGGSSGLDGRLERAALLLKAERHAEAEALLNEAIAQRPGDERSVLEARALRAVAMNRQGRHEASLRELEAVRAAVEEAIDAASSGAATTMEDVRRASHAMSLETALSAASEHAAALAAAGRPQEAVSILRRLLEQRTAPAFAAHASVELARLAVVDGRHAEALAVLDQGAEPLEALRADEAAGLVERSLCLRGICLLHVGEARDAARVLAEFATRFESSPLRPAADLARGDALLKSGDAEAAAAVLRRLTDSSPPPEIAAPALLRLGEACAACRRWSESEQACARFLAECAETDAGRPFRRQAQFGRAWACEQDGRLEAALEAYRPVVEGGDGGPTAARAQFQIGECLFALGRHQEALRELVKVDVLYAVPEWSAAALYEAGRCLAAMQRIDEARRQLQEVWTRFPDSPWAKLARDRAGELAPAPLPGRRADGVANLQR